MQKKEKVVGVFVKFDQFYDDFDDFMESKKILVLENIKEFYVHCDNDEKPNVRFSDNEKEFDKVFIEIKGYLMMFKQIKYSTYKNLFQKEGYYIKRTIIFIDQNNNEIIDWPKIISINYYLLIN